PVAGIAGRPLARQPVGQEPDGRTGDQQHLRRRQPAGLASLSAAARDRRRSQPDVLIIGGRRRQGVGPFDLNFVLRAAMTSSSELIGRAHDLLPTLKARAAETEALRRPHDDTIRDLIDAGIVQMLVPKRWGGAESDLKTVYEVVDVLAQGCISTAWIA